MQLAAWALYALIFLNLILFGAQCFGAFFILKRSSKLKELTEKTKLIRDEFMRRKAQQ